jgi:hypothetical protein
MELAAPNSSGAVRMTGSGNRFNSDQQQERAPPLIFHYIQHSRLVQISGGALVDASLA